MPAEPATDHLAILPLRERVAAVLRREIFEGQLAGGAELAQEDVAARLGISRMPVREAFQILERDGLLIRKTHYRAVVRPVTEADIRDHYEARAFIESELAARACARPENYASIEAAIAYAEGAVRKGEPMYVRAAIDFHRAIWDASGSSTMAMVASQLWTWGITPYFLELVPAAVDDSLREHRALLDVIRDGDAQRVRKLMSEHILGAMQTFLKHFGSSRQAREQVG